MTPESFAELLIQAINERTYPSGIGPSKQAARESKVSPASISRMCKGEFPIPPASNETKARRDKKVYGAVFSLTRVCDTFGFDLDACLEACGLPNLRAAVTRSRATRDEMLLQEDDLQMLLKQARIIGPISLELVPTLIANYRRNKGEA